MTFCLLPSARPDNSTGKGSPNPWIAIDGPTRDETSRGEGSPGGLVGDNPLKRDPFEGRASRSALVERQEGLRSASPEVLAGRGNGLVGATDGSTMAEAGTRRPRCPGAGIPRGTTPRNLPGGADVNRCAARGAVKTLVPLYGRGEDAAQRCGQIVQSPGLDRTIRTGPCRHRPLERSAGGDLT